ncbi:uncharacterized protein LOC129584434 [Paramacrobiotus metropolitanus]|uniref:uncharacterized protein LOC129584434 n=1 Tax=Paramacrobiotus metropolitanus TaxID=2943436 RepID=UPI002445783A|nr:uncharacterized protein LOC129584434 [Paramacrobiotus metropolitanus]
MDHSDGSLPSGSGVPFVIARDEKLAGYPLCFLGIAAHVTAEQMRATFQNLGSVKDLIISKNMASSRSGLIVFENHDSALKAMQTANNIGIKLASSQFDLFATTRIIGGKSETPGSAEKPRSGSSSPPKRRKPESPHFLLYFDIKPDNYGRFKKLAEKLGNLNPNPVEVMGPDALNGEEAFENCYDKTVPVRIEMTTQQDPPVRVNRIVFKGMFNKRQLAKNRFRNYWKNNKELGNFVNIGVKDDPAFANA